MKNKDGSKIAYVTVLCILYKLYLVYNVYMLYTNINFKHANKKK